MSDLVLFFLFVFGSCSVRVQLDHDFNRIALKPSKIVSKRFSLRCRYFNKQNAESSLKRIKHALQHNHLQTRGGRYFANALARKKKAGLVPSWEKVLYDAQLHTQHDYRIADRVIKANAWHYCLALIFNIATHRYHPFCCSLPMQH